MFTHFVLAARDYWQIGGKKLKTLGRLFNSFDLNDEAEKEDGSHRAEEGKGYLTNT